MSSLSQLFQKRSKKEQPSALGQLFHSNNVQKFTNISQTEKVNQPVRLPPEPIKKDEPQDLESTIFVGNVPLNFNHNNLKKIFNQYGKISKVWFRSIPVEQTKLKRKANCILKNYKEGADSKNAYVKFEQKQAAEKACASNGLKVDEHTLRVSHCLDNNLDYDTTAFVGNLPLDIKEEEFRAHFEQAGQIVNVRVVRDKTTRQGIGIGYVKFANKQEMFNAFKTMNGKPLKDRPLRVKRAVEKAKLEKKINRVVAKHMNKKGFTAPQDPKRMWKVSQKFKKHGTANPQRSVENKADSRKFHLKRKMIKK